MLARLSVESTRLAVAQLQAIHRASNATFEPTGEPSTLPPARMPPTVADADHHDHVTVESGRSRLRENAGARIALHADVSAVVGTWIGSIALRRPT